MEDVILRTRWQGFGGSRIVPGHACVEDGLRANQETLRLTRDHAPLSAVPVARFNKFMIVVLLLGMFVFNGCADLKGLVPRDTSSLLIPRFKRSEVFGFVAGFGTTFAALPDLIAMLKRRSSAGMNPRMAAIMGVFQILWVYYGLLILSRPVVAWNVVAVVINFLSVGAYIHFVRKGNDSKNTLQS